MSQLPWADQQLNSVHLDYLVRVQLKETSTVTSKPTKEEQHTLTPGPHTLMFLPKSLHQGVWSWGHDPCPQGLAGHLSASG